MGEGSVFILVRCTKSERQQASGGGLGAENPVYPIYEYEFDPLQDMPIITRFVVTSNTPLEIITGYKYQVALASMGPEEEQR